MKKQYFESDKPPLIPNKGRFAGFAAIGSLVGTAIFFMVTGITGHQRGVYGSYQYRDGLNAAEHVLAHNYGLTFTSDMKLLSPPVYNTHLESIKQKPTKTNDLLTFDSGQVRVFRLEGPRGVRWCVGIWDNSYHSGNRNYGKYFVTKSCTLKPTHA